MRLIIRKTEDQVGDWVAACALRRTVVLPLLLLPW